jgi:uncharacterized protein YndB with AHSA1/START domain
MTSFTYQTWIKASPEEIWDFLVDPERSGQYGYGGRTEYELKPGGRYKAIATPEMQQFGMPEVLVDGEVIEVEAPRKLAYTWRAYFDEAIAAEPANRVTVELGDVDPRMFPDGGVTQVTLTHELDGAPITAGIVSGQVAEGGGGWGFILSDLKTKIETGTSLHGR